MTPSETLSEIRAGCRYVANVADHVKVVGNPASYARAFDLAVLAAPTYDDVHHFRGSEWETVAYVLTLDAVNFGSGWFPKLRKTSGMSGYFTVASRLKERFEATGPLRAQELAEIEAAAVARIFGQTLDDPDIADLMGHFALAWRELGAMLLDRFDGSFTELVTTAEHSAARLVDILAAMPAFQDVAAYRGEPVPFYKRAQIAVSDLDLALGGQGLGRFDDLDQLTIFADNLVPHVLRVDGIVAYDDALRDRIDRDELLPPGSPEEIEIRAVAVYVVERMVASLRGEGRAVTARDLDVALWNRGQEPRYRAVRRHRTRTVFY